MKTLALILILALTGCALPPETLKGSGVEADAPLAYKQLCFQHPELAVCQKAKP